MSNEMAAHSQWDQRYNEADPEGQQILDNGAQRWFKKKFSDLDEEDQNLVVKNEGYNHGDHVHYASKNIPTLEMANTFIKEREMAERRPLNEIMQKTQHHGEFMRQAEREGYTMSEIQNWLQENDKEWEKEIYGSTQDQTTNPGE